MLTTHNNNLLDLLPGDEHTSNQRLPVKGWADWHGEVSDSKSFQQDETLTALKDTLDQILASNPDGPPEEYTRRGLVFVFTCTSIGATAIPLAKQHQASRPNRRNLGVGTGGSLLDLKC
jgi:hypothetical protein